MNPKAEQLRARTHRFLIRVSKWCETLPRTPTVESIRPQLLDAAGSTDSNYRAACRARSKKEFIAKLGVAAEEADESKGWLEALVSNGLGDAREAKSLIQEANELTAIFVASQKTAKSNDSRGKSDTNVETSGP